MYMSLVPRNDPTAHPYGGLVRRGGDLTRKCRAGAMPIAIALTLSGCTRQAAPSFSLFGAYFPVWLFCMAIGVAGAICARVVLVASGLSSVVPAQLAVCTAIGVIVASLCWLLWLGR